MPILEAVMSPSEQKMLKVIGFAIWKMLQASLIGWQCNFFLQLYLFQQVSGESYRRNDGLLPSWYCWCFGQ